jgi:RND superfamily putative drug exporter
VFGAIGRFDRRFRWLIVAVWIAMVLAAVRLLPSLSSVAQSGNTQFLSSSEPSVQAAQLAMPFQTRDPSGTAIIVASRDSGPLTAEDNAAIGREEQAAQRVSEVTAVVDLGMSKDGQAAEALVTVAASALSSDTASLAVVNALRASFAQADAPPGLTFHLTGPLAVAVDGANTNAGNNITRFTLIFVIVLLFVVYRAALAPVITLIPAALAVALSGPLIAELTTAGVAVSSISQLLLVVLILGAGSDYGLFLSFRVREELAGGREPGQAVVVAVERVGAAITYSAVTVAAALLALLLAPFGLYRGLGPALAIGIAVLLAASLTLTPALLAIFGRAAFWPTRPAASAQRVGLWGRVAERVVRRPVLTLAAGIVLFGVFSAGLIGYRTGGLSNRGPATSDSATGAAVLAAHFPRATVGSEQLLLRFGSPVWDGPSVLTQTQKQLADAPAFQSVAGPLGSGSGSLTGDELAGLHGMLGPAAALPPGPPASGSTVSPDLYAAYRASAQFISPDGKTIQYYAVPRAGAVGSAAAADAIPVARDALAAVAAAVGAEASGVAGQDAATSDINHASTASLELVIPVVLVVILILLGLMLRSLVAPWYLALTVALSYLATLGFAMVVFVHLGGSDGLIFVLPLLLFVFSMALGADYNILLMSRIREEAHEASLPVALIRAIGITGGTITSAGIILAGTFAVLGLVGGSTQAQQLGFSVAFGVLLDTFFVRTLLVPSIAVLLGRWNWWPSALSKEESGGPPKARPGIAAT